MEENGRPDLIANAIQRKERILREALKPISPDIAAAVRARFNIVIDGV